jgi:hypothetical protein
MNVATLTSPSWLYTATLDTSLSGTGAELRDAVRVALEHPRPSRSEGLVETVVGALKKAQREGIRVRADVFARVLDLLSVLPDGIPLPEIVIETESEVGLDWDMGARRVLAVTVDETSFLGFAALFGAEPMHGRILFAGETPQTLLYVLSRIYSGPHV